MGKEYWGCVYHRPPVATTNTDDITVDRIRRQVVPHLTDKPVLVEHRYNRNVGKVTRCWQDPTDGSLYVGLRLREHSPDAQSVEQSIRTRQMLGLSLGHGYDRDTGDVLPLEVSIVKNGKRPNAEILNASATALGKPMNLVAATPPSFLPLLESASMAAIPNSSDASPTSTPGLFHAMTPEMKAALSLLAQQLNISQSNIPAALQQFNPALFEANQRNEEAQRAQSMAQQQVQQEAAILQQADAIRQMRAAAAAAASAAAIPPPQPPAPTVAGDAMDASEAARTLAGQKRRNAEAELEPLKRQIEERDQQLNQLKEKQKQTAWVMFEEVEKKMRLNNAGEDAIRDLKLQVESTADPIALLRVMKSMTGAGSSSSNNTATPMETKSKTEAAPPTPAATPVASAASSASLPFNASQLQQAIQQAAQQQWSYTPTGPPATAMASSSRAPALGNAPIPLPNLAMVQASALPVKTDNPLEAYLYAYLQACEPHVGNRVKGKGKTRDDGMWLDMRR
jgi:hypothetical protein